MTITPTIPRLAALAVAAFFSFSPGAQALAQTPPAPAVSDDGCCWIDTKTGKQVRTVPLSGVNIGGLVDAGVAVIDSLEPKRAHNSRTGQNFFRQPDGCWIDTKTGKQVRTAPLSGVNIGGLAAAGVAIIDSFEPKRAHNSRTGQNFFRSPCPPPEKPKNTDGGKTGYVPARLELGLGYCYMHAADEPVKSLNGFTLSGIYPVNSWLAATGEFSGLYGSETRLFAGGDVKNSLDRYLYLFGPQVTLLPSGPVRVFGRLLAGGVHDVSEVSFRGGSTRFSANAFALALGASAEVPVAPRASVGVSFDYAPTHFTSPTGNNWQQNWRVGVGGKISF